MKKTKKKKKSKKLIKETKLITEIIKDFRIKLVKEFLMTNQMMNQKKRKIQN